VCQFSRSFGSSLHVEEGQQLGVSLEEGQLVIKNTHNQDGKMFSESVRHDDRAWNYHIVLSLLEP
jgi:hypothetical protein